LEALQILREVEAVMPHGHFVMKSGLHTSEYINKDAIYRYPAKLQRLGVLLAERFRFRDIDVVLGPAVGGALLANSVALALNSFLRPGRAAEAAYADKDGDGFVIRRGYEEAVRARKILLVDDVISTGSSVAGLLLATREKGGQVVALGVICNRGGVSAEALGVPELQALAGTIPTTWLADKCPMCLKGTPVSTSLGHGREFLAQKASS
jgi:orotate phosphoribosyltransferase